MKTLKYIILGVILSSLVVSSFSFSPSRKTHLPGRNSVPSVKPIHSRRCFQNSIPQEYFLTLIHKEGTDPESSRIGTCNEADLKTLWNYIQIESFRSKVPEDLIIAAGAEASGPMIPLYAIRKSASNDVFPSQQDIEELSVSLDSNDNYSLLISFSQSGAEKWASITKKNKGRNIAILFDGKVLAAPRVTEEIKGGKCSISGNYTEAEINQLKAALEN